jgi:DtxR family Mn-dependent transcriptional regulator
MFMIQKTWKLYEQNTITHSLAHHLMAIHTLIKENGYARATDIAKYLSVSRANVSMTLEKLKEKNYVKEDHNRHLRLSSPGKNIVYDVLSKRKVIESFFHHVLDLDINEAEENACKIEHLLSNQTAKMWISFMGYVMSEEEEAKKFRKKLKFFQYHCKDLENCDICDVRCFIKSLNK